MGGGRGGLWGVDKKKKGKATAPLSFYFDFSPPPPSHSLIPLMKSGQAEACSRRRQFHCTICGSHVGWQGGEGSVGSTARREEENTRHQIHNGLQPGRSDPLHVFLSAASARAPLATRPRRIHPTPRLRHVTNDTWPVVEMWTLNAGKQMSQVLTQKEPGTPHKMVVSGALFGPSLHRGCGADTLIMWLERMGSGCVSAVVAFRLPLVYLSALRRCL